ncbi:DUF6193 family natural product biosynthesis protein [Streptomyces sp. NPDC002773]|uniref:DUF6193 family natural product biosynthesis protein n=1 Tax=Streptomyces sp. NPDC002773 TaxID=3154430 RepID=UPI003321F248
MMDTVLYPELSPDAGDPGAGLLRIAASAGITLASVRVTSSPSAPHGPVTVVVTAERGAVHVVLERDRHEIQARLNMPWLGAALHGRAETLEDVAEAIGDWERGDPLTLIAGRRAWLTASPRAVAQEEGRAAEYAWDVERAAAAGQWPLLEEAYNTPELRRLVPFVTHGRITFHRAPAPPFSHDLWEIGPAADGCLRVGGQSEPLSEHTVVATAAEAIALVVQALPPDCGRAVQATGTGG